MGTKHFLSAALTFVIQERQVTSLCGVRPILHRIKKCSYGAYGAKEKPADIPLPRSLTRSARSFGCGERYLHTDKDKGIRRDRQGRKRMRLCRFSIGSAPLTSITKSDAQISGGETRQDYKDTRRFPLVAPSCALLFLPFGLPVSFRCYGRVYLIPRLTLSSG